MSICSKLTVAEKVKIRTRVLFSGIILRFLGFICGIIAVPNALFSTESQTTLALSIRTLSSPY